MFGSLLLSHDILYINLEHFFVVEIVVVLASVHAQTSNAITELVRIVSCVVFAGQLRMHLDHESILDITASP